MLKRSTRKIFLTALVMCALLCALTCARFASPARAKGHVATAESAATREGRLRVFDEVWEQIRERYFDPKLQGVDWQEAREVWRPRAASAGTESELYAALRRMLALLHDPHTRVFAPGESTDWRVLRYVSVGVSVRELGREVVVTDVERNSDAERAHVRAGDAIISVDGEPAASLVARRMTDAGAGVSSAARLAAVTRLFDGPRDTTVSVILRRAGETRERGVTLRREPRTRVPSFEVRRKRDGIRLVTFNIFTPEVAAQFTHALGNELEGARSLVIDLRDNGGGEAEAMADLASTLLPSGLSLGRFTNREGRVQLEPFTRDALLSSANSFARFRGPVILLTNARTASAAEVFAASLREARRATVIGETTCGCVLGIRRRHQLPDGGILDISEMDYHTAGGARLEGHGLSPDEKITPTREDLRRGRDRALDFAIEVLKARK